MERRRGFARWSPPLERPLTVALAYLALAVGAVVIGFGTGLPRRLTLVVSAAFVLVGLGKAGLMLLGIAQRRRAADRLLRTGVSVHPESELLTRRAAELTSVRNRRMLAGSLRSLVREVERPAVVSAVPLNRRGLGPKLPLFRSLVDRVADVERPVAPQGMVLVEDLLTDGFESPLYLGGRSEDVATAIERCLAALDRRGTSERTSARSSEPPIARQRPRARVHSGGGLH